MTGVTASLTTLGLDDAIRTLGTLAGFDMAQLADEAGALLESSTRRRFETKIAPDGEAWVPWSEAYDDTRDHSRHSLLVSEGDLLDSVQSYSTGTAAHVGSNLVYAAHHHFGGDEIGSGLPARPYLGVSAEDELDLSDLVTGRLQELLQ
jgi:phage virion morphogenesis protein